MEVLTALTPTEWIRSKISPRIRGALNARTRFSVKKTKAPFPHTPVAKSGKVFVLWPFKYTFPTASPLIGQTILEREFSLPLFHKDLC